MIEGLDTSGNTHPLWFTNCQLPTFPQLHENLDIDVCVIGGGIAGLTTAYKLCCEGKKVVVLEDGHIASGESGRTSAHLCNALDDRFYELERVFGEQGAKYAAESHSAAIDTIEKIIKDENIDCEFKRVDGYLFLDPKDGIHVLEKELAAATRVGLKVELMRNGTNQFHLGPCLRFANQAKFHPLKYLTGLAQAIVNKGGKIYNKTHAAEIKPGAKVTIKTANGFTVHANYVVIATNTPVFDKAFLFSKQEANRTYMIGAVLKNENLEDALFWDTGDPYHYLRLNAIKDNDKEVILTIGGEDHRTGKKVDADQCFKNLEEWARKHIPELGKVKYQWSGQVMEPVDHLAFIGRNPTSENNIFLVSGDSGNGLTHGTIGGILITDLIQGRDNPWWEIYNPARKPMKNIPSLATHNLTGASAYTKYLTPGDVTDIKQIPPGEGAIVRDGVHKQAVYRDEHGKYHKCSAICPHMGAIISWNSLEKSWDCPAHGSRFTPKGDVMNGPANVGLTDLVKEEKKEKVSEE